jgi:anti-sigma-K factor RskA
VEDLKSYLESGILEQYILGDLSSEEMLEVENNALKYPEIRSELAEIEHALLNYAKSNAIEPAGHLRNRIISSLDINDTEISSIHPVRGSVSKPIQFYKYAFAASLTLLFISVILLINLNNKLNDSYTQIAVLQSGNQRFSNQVNYIDEELRDTRNALHFYQNQAAYKLVTLKGSPKAPAASMLIAFNSEKEEVMIDLSSLKVPYNDKEHQYQLWALVDGKPVDLGVFDASADSTGMKKMKSVKNVQAFAVTLEPRGGSVNPTMEQMMVIGNI